MVHFFDGVMSSLMGCFPLSAMSLGFSPLDQGGEDVNWWKSMRVDLQGTQEGYFIDCESALGVMTGWRALLDVDG
jgi:hypothetical protein